MLPTPPVFILPFLLIYVVYLLLTKAFPHYFLVPPLLWQDKILAVINHPKPIYLKVGSKRSAYRRRLITASCQPSFYTNFVNNKLKIHPTDCENENDSFMSAMKHRAPEDPERRIVYGFFHPYANNGGGGEKVLWHAVQSTLLEDPRNIVSIYTTNTEAEPLAILDKAQAKFNVGGLDSKRIVFVYLRKFGKYIDGGYWKHFTLIGQLFGSVLLGLEAMYELSPDVWVDTQGLPGSYLLVSLVLKVPIVAYVHYPMIQPEMFAKLLSKQLGKFVYWKAVYGFYMYLGSLVDVVFANGTWTYNHLRGIWVVNTLGHKTMGVLYPPCSTENFSVTAPSERSTLLYIAQFRPEKRHMLVLHEYSRFIARARANKLLLAQIPPLVLLGSCRTPTDVSTLDSVQQATRDLELSDFVSFVVDCSFEEMQANLAKAKFGLNAMWNEHFGIGVVEYMSAGVVPIVHASAGPLLDIVADDIPATSWQNDLGYFFKCDEDPDMVGEQEGEFVFEQDGKKVAYPLLGEVLGRIYIESPQLASEANLAEKRARGANVVQQKFSTKVFTESWMAHLKTVAQLEVQYREDRRDTVNRVY